MKKTILTYKFRVSLPGKKGFFRIYEVNENNTLHAFHRQMKEDMAFPPDQIVLFKGYDASNTLIAKYATFDIFGPGSSIEHITIRHIIEAGITSFVYFYDTTNKRSVVITLLEQGSNSKDIPVLLEAKGPSPDDFYNGYIAPEDLPARTRTDRADDFDEEDDDDTEEEEEEDGEDFKEIYEENSEDEDE